MIKSTGKIKISPLIAVAIIFIVIVGAILFISNRQGSINLPFTSGSQNSDISKVADEVLLSLKNKDFNSLKRYVNAKRELGFSPYANISKDNIKFSAEEVGNLGKSTKIYQWGLYDGSGVPIKLSFNDYYKKFIYDKDFIKGENSINQKLGEGNSIDNIKDFFPEATVSEYYLKGSEEEGGMDWASLRLVFEKIENTWYLVYIVHDAWTI